MKYADISIQVTVKFEDNGEDDLTDQALDIANWSVRSDEEIEVVGMELVGLVRETEFPA